MKELTTEDKLALLKEAYQTYCLNVKMYFICTAIRAAYIRIYGEMIRQTEIFKTFPELLNYRPDDKQVVWFPPGQEGFEDRDRIFQELIKTYEGYVGSRKS